MKKSFRIVDLLTKKYLVQTLIKSQTKNLKIENETIICFDLQILRLLLNNHVWTEVEKVKVANNGSCMHFISIFWQEKRKPLEKGSMTVIPPVL